MRTPHLHRRVAFTLVELLVVIAIIAILVSLLTAGVFSYLRRATEVKNASDVGQLSTAAGAFKSKFGIYPPSQITLYRKATDYSLGDKSLAVLYQIWPRLWTGSTTTVDWSGGLVSSWPAAGIVLEGDQCLVFFLGGIPTGPDASAPFGPNARGCLGFSTNPTNPADLISVKDRIGPYYDFQSPRLIRRHTNPFYSYLDAYGDPNFLKPDGTVMNTAVNLSPLRADGKPNPAFVGQPFAYFSSGKRPNSYTAPPGTDCPLIGAFPYLKQTSPTNTFHNSDTFQIISAGADKQFGGGLWDPTSPAGVAPLGFDDRTNFCGNTLGVGN